MGCISSKKEIEDNYPNIFQVMNVDEHGNHVNPGQIEITDLDLVLYQRGKSPIKWPLRTLRRYGFDAEHFSFESGRRCQTGPGIYAFRCRRAEQLFNLLQSRIQTRINGETDSVEPGSNLVNSSSARDSIYLEPTSLRRANHEGRFSSQNGVTRLSSVGSASGSLGPLSPQSINSGPSPLDTVPLLPPPLANCTSNQNVYANEEIVHASIVRDFEETNNNNKTPEETSSPASLPERSRLNSAALDVPPKDDSNDSASESRNLIPEEVSSPKSDNDHLYMNIIPGTDKVAPRFPTVLPAFPSGNFVTLKWDNREEVPGIPNYANFEARGSLPRKRTNDGAKRLNYIVLDLEPGGDPPPKSPVSGQPADLSRKISGGYAAIDFKKTVALSHSVNPNFDTDSESSRKTRHSSNANNGLPAHERHSSSVSD